MMEDPVQCTLYISSRMVGAIFGISEPDKALSLSLLRLGERIPNLLIQCHWYAITKKYVYTIPLEKFFFL